VASYKLVGNAGNALPNAQCTNGTVLFNGLGTTANVTGLTPQRTYSFRLCAVDNAGNTSSGSAFRLTTARR
jgi:hypothetical protein